MKFALVATISALVCIATAATPTSSPDRTRHLGYKRLLPFWSPRSSRRDLSPTSAARKRDDPPPSFSPAPSLTGPDDIGDGAIALASEPTGDPPGIDAVPAPTISDPFDIVEVFPTFVITGPLSGSSTSSSVAASITSSPTGLPDEAGDSVWEDAASHGCQLVDAMRRSDIDAGKLYNPVKVSVQSNLMSFSDFESWGWTANEVTGDNFTDIDGGQKHPDPGWGIGNVLRALKVSDKIKDQGGKNVIIDAVHGHKPFDGQTYNKDGRTYPVTGSEFKIGVNAEEGVLMAVERTSPVNAAKQRHPQVSDDQLPAVRTLSDIGYLNYKRIANKDPNSLQYMMSLMITNEKTASIIARALKSKGRGLGPWPGESFSWKSKEFKALLGSPNGMGFGYLLVQHKSQLGNMFITQVQVFSGDTWHQLPNMVFTVKAKGGTDPPPKSPGDPPKMEESAAPTSAPIKLKRSDRAPETRVHMQGKKNMRREHIAHIEL